MLCYKFFEMVYGYRDRYIKAFVIEGTLNDVSKMTEHTKTVRAMFCPDSHSYKRLELIQRFRSVFEPKARIERCLGKSRLAQRLGIDGPSII